MFLSSEEGEGPLQEFYNLLQGRSVGSVGGGEQSDLCCFLRLLQFKIFAPAGCHILGLCLQPVLG